MDIDRQAPLPMGFSRQEYWRGLPCPSPGHLPHPGIEPTLSCLLHWQVGSLPLVPPGKPSSISLCNINFLMVQRVKNLTAVQETQILSLGQEDPLEQGMATHSSILPWEIPWTEETGGLQSWGRKESDTTE